jgi:hypothetical protein
MPISFSFEGPRDHPSCLKIFESMQVLPSPEGRIKVIYFEALLSST